MQACCDADIMCAVVRVTYEHPGTTEETREVHVQGNVPGDAVLELLGLGGNSVVEDLRHAGLESRGNQNQANQSH